MILSDKQSRFQYVKVFTLIFVIGIILFILKTFALPIFFESHDTFQLRDKRKSGYKVKITTGPIDLDRGIVDMVTLGMSKVEVHQRFGEVLVRPLTIQEGQKFGGSYGGMDGNENKSDELLDTAYAWVEYASWNRPEEAVRLIRFKLGEFTRLFNADEQLWIRYKNKNVIITKDMKQNKIIRKAYDCRRRDQKCK